jgi:ankyrin repeat protein
MTEMPRQDVQNEFVASAHHDMQRVSAMLAEHPALVHAVAVWNETPVQAAAHVGNVEIARLLIGHGARADLCTQIVLGERDEVMRQISADPALANATGAHGLTALYFAAIAGDLEMARFLYAHGAALEGGEGASTALHGAVMADQPDIVAWLLEQGASREARNFNDRTPLEVAEENGSEHLNVLLRQAGA